MTKTNTELLAAVAAMAPIPQPETEPDATPRRCALHPCESICRAGRVTCDEHEHEHANVLERYGAFVRDDNSRRDRVWAERQATNEIIGQRVDRILAERRAARGETP